MLAELTVASEPTTRSENDFRWLVRDLEDLEHGDAPVEDHEHRDEAGDLLVLTSGMTVLRWTDGASGVTFVVPPDHMSVFAIGMPWRSYGDRDVPLTRLYTAEYERTLAAFERGIAARRYWRVTPSQSH